MLATESGARRGSDYGTPTLQGTGAELYSEYGLGLIAYQSPPTADTLDQAISYSETQPTMIAGGWLVLRPVKPVE